MKRAIVFILLSNIFIATWGQTNEGAEKIYQQAKKYNDRQMMISALYDIITKYPPTTEWKDSLALVYFSSGNYVSALLVATDVLQNTQKDNILELKALCEQQLGLLKDALSSYEQLFKNTGKPYYLYQVATIQYQLKRYGECEQTINALLNDPKSREEKINIVTNNQQQQVNMVAASYNIQGVMFKDLSKFDEAKQAFQAALEISPDFLLAKSNLEAIERELEASESKELPVNKKPEKKKKK